jgi:outer membrane protein assembly factor BamB
MRWQRDIGSSVRMTPALVDGALLVGVYGEFGGPGEKPHGAAFLSLDAATGKIRWRTPLPGLVRSEPVVIDGVIYEGLAGGDPFSGCFDGRVVAIDQRTGAMLPHVRRSAARANNGVGIWGPLSTDGRTIYVGTGNACDEARSGAGDSIVALTPSLRMVWRTSARVPGVEDSDVGGGVALVGGRAYVAGKSGYFYTLDRGDGRILERHDLNPFARNGGSIGTPTGDGSVLLISSGPKRDPDSAGTLAGNVMTVRRERPSPLPALERLSRLRVRSVRAGGRVHRARSASGRVRRGDGRGVVVGRVGRSRVRLAGGGPKRRLCRHQFRRRVRVRPAQRRGRAVTPRMVPKRRATGRCRRGPVRLSLR